MNKEWRSEDWKTPYDNSHSYGETCPVCDEDFGTEESMKYAFEEGASAMLEARDKWWIEKMEYMRKNCGSMPICKGAECGWYIQSKNCTAWEAFKKEINP
jgi:hypothetical protein